MACLARSLCAIYQMIGFTAMAIFYAVLGGLLLKESSSQIGATGVHVCVCVCVCVRVGGCVDEWASVRVVC